MVNAASMRPAASRGRTGALVREARAAARRRRRTVVTSTPSSRSRSAIGRDCVSGERVVNAAEQRLGRAERRCRVTVPTTSVARSADGALLPVTDQSDRAHRDRNYRARRHRRAAEHVEVVVAAWHRPAQVRARAPRVRRCARGTRRREAAASCPGHLRAGRSRRRARCGMRRRRGRRLARPRARSRRRRRRAEGTPLCAAGSRRPRPRSSPRARGARTSRRRRCGCPNRLAPPWSTTVGSGSRAPLGQVRRSSRRSSR